MLKEYYNFLADPVVLSGYTKRNNNLYKY